MSQHQSLYQKYRPHTFDDVVGQAFVKKVLMNSIRTKKIHHGYIFFGFHGIGKTTLARIFAQTVNCLSPQTDGNPCRTCAHCVSFEQKKMIDVIEIDAASYTGVDNIREIIDHARFTPTQGTYKVYIIDEVHMLSKGAFNALLKTLEEPPSHAIFLLATTEIQKIPDTILSRVIRFDLERINDRDMMEMLERVCTGDSVQAEESALKLIIHRARGSLRDALTMLEKCIYEGTVSRSYVEGALQLVSSDFLEKTLQGCISGDGYVISEILQTIQTVGIDTKVFAAQMTEWITDTLDRAFAKNAFHEYYEVFQLFTRVYAESKIVSVPSDVLTMALCSRIKTGAEALKMSTSSPMREETPAIITPTGLDDHAPRSNDIPQKPISPPIQIDAPQKESAPEEAIIMHTDKSSEQMPPEPESPPASGGTETAFSSQKFLDTLISLGAKATLTSLMRTAEITISHEHIHIMTSDFGKNKCSDPEHRAVMTKAAQICGYTDVSVVSTTPEAAPDTDVTTAAREIFG